MHNPLMSDQQEASAENNLGELREVPTETGTIRELIDAGRVGSVAGCDGAAIVDPILPDNPEEAEKLKWRFDF